MVDSKFLIKTLRSFGFDVVKFSPYHYRIRNPVSKTDEIMYLRIRKRYLWITIRFHLWLYKDMWNLNWKVFYRTLQLQVAIAVIETKPSNKKQ